MSVRWYLRLQERSERDRVLNHVYGSVLCKPHLTQELIDDAMALLNDMYDGVDKIKAENAALKAEVEALRTHAGCILSGPGRGDCFHYVGLPGPSIPNQHDGPDDTVDDYGKPNVWCWFCWLDYQNDKLKAEVEAANALKQVIMDALGLSTKRISELMDALTWVRDHLPGIVGWESVMGSITDHINKALKDHPDA